MMRIQSALIWLGGIALLAATAINTLSVVGHNIGWPLHGAIELIQVTIVIAAAVALVQATLLDAHAKVHFLFDRLSERQRHWLGALFQILSVVMILGLLVGSMWIAVDLWHASEESEVLHVPWKPLRLIANLGLAGMLGIFLVKTIRGLGQ